MGVFMRSSNDSTDDIQRESTCCDSVWACLLCDSPDDDVAVVEPIKPRSRSKSRSRSRSRRRSRSRKREEKPVLKSDGRIATAEKKTKRGSFFKRKDKGSDGTKPKRRSFLSSRSKSADTASVKSGSTKSRGRSRSGSRIAFLTRSKSESEVEAPPPIVSESRSFLTIFQSHSEETPVETKKKRRGKRFGRQAPAVPKEITATNKPANSSKFLVSRLLL